MEAEHSIVFIIVAFCLGLVLIMSKDNITPKLKKWLAIWAIIMILFAFFIIIYSLFTSGT